ncbi:MAG: hypothetical protein QOF00_727 [Pseudonocardiales bacterium]|nr:hypothetical protein [Pseudonocardiales bacterium]
MPERIQLRRTRGWRKPEGAVVVSRPSRWGNPFPVGGDVPDRARSVALYEQYLADRPELRERARAELRGRDLACWCPVGEPCHGDVLMRVANALRG